MKRSIVILGFGVLLLLLIATVVQGAKAKAVRAAPKQVEETSPKSSAVKSQTASRTAAPAIAAPQTKTVSPARPEGTVVVPVHPPDMAPAAASENYQISWQSVNGGGGPASSASYNCDASAGQVAIGYATSASYETGIGYWYGVSGGGGTDCNCPYQCDYDADGFLTSLDLGSLIDVLFAGKPEETDPNCPSSRGDFDYDGFPTSLDLGGLIDHLFAGGASPCDPCAPVQSSCTK